MAKIQPQNKIQVLPVEEDLNWCLDKLVNGWMRIIGIEPNIPEKKGYWRWIVWLIQRWTCFFLALGIIVYLLISLYLKQEEAAKKSSSTQNWNEWMDFVALSFQTISVHLLLLIVISPKWNELRTAMNDAEHHLLNYPRVYPQIRKIVPFVVAPLLLMVGILVYISFYVPNTCFIQFKF